MAPIAELLRDGVSMKKVAFTGDVKISADTPITAATLSVHTEDGLQKLDELLEANDHRSKLTLQSDSTGFVSYEHYTPVDKVTLPAGIDISVKQTPVTGSAGK